MNFKLLVVFVSLVIMASLDVSAQARDEGTTLLKTTDGVMVVHSVKGSNFTLELKGKEIRLLDSKEGILLGVEGRFVQVQIAQFSKFLSGPKLSTDQAMLDKHRDWEANYLKDLLKFSLDIKSEPIKTVKGQEALYWEFAMPEEISKQVNEQVFLTAVVGDSVLVLNGSVMKDGNKGAVRDYLMATLSTLEVSVKPLNVESIQESIRRRSPSNR